MFAPIVLQCGRRLIWESPALIPGLARSRAKREKSRALSHSSSNVLNGFYDLILRPTPQNLYVETRG